MHAITAVESKFSVEKNRDVGAEPCRRLGGELFCLRQAYREFCPSAKVAPENYRTVQRLSYVLSDDCPNPFFLVSERCATGSRFFCLAILARLVGYAILAARCRLQGLTIQHYCSVHALAPRRLYIDVVVYKRS